MFRQTRGGTDGSWVQNGNGYILSRSIHRSMHQPKLIAACTSLSAVSEFGKLSTNVTQSQPAIDGRAEALQVASTMAPVSGRPNAQKNLLAAREQQKVADAGLKALSLYFATLSSLADSKLRDTSADAASISKALQGAQIINSSMATSIQSIVGLVTSPLLAAWQGRAVSNLIDAANDPVQRLADDLAKLADDAASDRNYDARLADDYFDPTSSKDKGIQRLLESQRSASVANFDQRIAQADAARDLLLAVKNGQAALQKNKDKLTSAELKANLDQYGNDIVNATKLIRPGA
jgi:hypothetical protein